MRKTILMGVPHHNNLGDSAIGIAEKRFIEDNFKDYKYYELSEETLEKCIDKVKDYIDDEDLIFLHGGGNLGDEYLYIEEARRKVIQLFPNNYIIMFPQTIYFSDTSKGREELEKTKQIYSKHKKLTISAREEVSYGIMKKEFQNNRVIRVLDIVTYLNKTEKRDKRKGLLFILRDDIEAKIDNEQKAKMDLVAKKYFNEISYSDTARGTPILAKNRERRLEEILEKYRNAELVITDRFHGMIFAAITSTPCIALQNYNHKMKSGYETLKHLDYIKYIDNIEQLEEQIDYLMNNEFAPYNNDFAVKQFQQLKEGGKQFE